MKELIKNICVAIVLGFFLVWISELLDSDYLAGFFYQNLIMLLIALLAINITTMSIIVAKLTEVGEVGENSFPMTIAEMRSSVIEQIILIVFGLTSQILHSSKLVLSWNIFPKIKFLLDSLPAIILVYAIIILWDTAQAVFVLLCHKHKA